MTNIPSQFAFIVQEQEADFAKFASRAQPREDDLFYRAWHELDDVGVKIASAGPSGFNAGAFHRALDYCQERIVPLPLSVEKRAALADKIMSIGIEHDLFSMQNEALCKTAEARSEDEIYAIVRQMLVHAEMCKEAGVFPRMGMAVKNVVGRSAPWMAMERGGRHVLSRTPFAAANREYWRAARKAQWGDKLKSGRAARDDFANTKMQSLLRRQQGRLNRYGNEQALQAGITGSPAVANPAARQAVADAAAKRVDRNAQRIQQIQDRRMDIANRQTARRGKTQRQGPAPATEGPAPIRQPEVATPGTPRQGPAGPPSALGRPAATPGVATPPPPAPTTAATGPGRATATRDPAAAAAPTPQVQSGAVPDARVTSVQPARAPTTGTARWAGRTSRRPRRRCARNPTRPTWWRRLR